jgi:hypothetical protein
MQTVEVSFSNFVEIAIGTCEKRGCKQALQPGISSQIFYFKQDTHNKSVLGCRFLLQFPHIADSDGKVYNSLK